MKNLLNIEKLPGKNHYIGYAAGTVWSIQKTTSSDGNWVAFPRDRDQSSPYPWRIAAMRLDEMSKKLASL